MTSIKFKNKRLFYLDQTQLPLKEVWKECRNLKDGFKAIKLLEVRGAPLIGVFAAYCIAINLKQLSGKKEIFLSQLAESLRQLGSARPTAVNLFWALRRIKQAANKAKAKDVSFIRQVVLREACSIHKEDVLLCRRMADQGVGLIKKGDRILTHCNTGSLATSGEGTALAVIFAAAKKYRNHLLVYADETRPLLQGARLTAWELFKKKIPSKVICDNTASSLMAARGIDKVFLGADRIAANGDAANKIGTYGVAIAAKYHKIPFYVVAPFSTFDLSLRSGKEIPIEQRNPDEVRKIMNKIEVAPGEAKVYNPAFDVTPNELITAIVSDRGIIRPPYKKNIKKVIGTHPI
ncbi:MAG: S-methyl-5-thioribose-1-phosphate isomerase [Candidatus Omnitrophica bacterium]|nr:S-methyl-5-thioribose-1-phosphate isomerase [Candidatus Omnitrophota bacterium]MBU2266260.1 S-methyl-5-thioribose-1-phosphate isomerase [Candidatus Omnitrophota bacterium]